MSIDGMPLLIYMSSACSHPRRNLLFAALAVVGAAQALPMRFSISMGIRPDDATLRARLERVMSNRYAEIRTLLASYGVPLVAETQPAPVAEAEPGS